MRKKIYSLPFLRNLSKTAFIVCFLLLGLSAKYVKADFISGYTCTEAAHTYACIAGTVITTSTNTSTNVTLPFTFNYNGVPTTVITVNSNGWIMFGSGSTPATGLGSSETSPISSATSISGSGGVISAYGLAGAASSYKNTCNTSAHVAYLANGTTSFTIEWEAWSNGSGNNLTAYDAQITLYNTTNVIVMAYQVLNAYQVGLATLSGQVGIRGTTNATFQNWSIGSGTTSWVSATLGSSNSAATMLISSSNYTTLKTDAFTFTPPTFCTPPGTSATNYGSSNYVDNGSSSTASINFTRGNGNGIIAIVAMDAIPNFTPVTGTVYSGGNAAFASGTALGNGYLVYNSTTAGDGSTVVTVNLTALTSGHSYYVFVYEYSSSGSGCYQSSALSGNFCIGAPAVASITSSVNPSCPSVVSILSLTGLATTGPAYSYLWQSSSTSGSGYATASGSPANASYSTPTPLPYATTYYICQVTCPKTSNTTQSNQLTQNQNSFLNCYCNYASFTNTSSSTDIANVNLVGNSVTLNNTTANTTVHYNVYTSPVPDLSQNSTYTLKVTVGSSTRRHNLNAWIDWDQNGVFGNNANELIGGQTGLTTGQGSVQYSWSFTVPATSLQGTTALRVDYDNSSTTTGFQTESAGTIGSNSPCVFTAAPGETQDYRITVSGCAAPSTQASSFVTDPSPTTTSCNVKFTRGNGDGGMLVVVKAGSAPTSPTPGVAYSSPNANITAGGSTTAAGSYVIYNSNSPSSGQVTVPATNLTPNTTYYFAAYEWNASTGNCYDLVSPPNGTCVIPLCIQPTTQVTYPSVSGLATTSATLNWTAGSGNKTLVILKQGSAVSGVPVLTTTYTDNLNFNFGSPSGSQIGTGNYVMFGDGGADNSTSATITGLTPSTSYYYAIYAYFSSTHCYDFTSPLAGNFTTSSCSPSTQPSSPAISCYGYTTANLTFTRGNGNRAIVLAHAGSAVNSDPVYNTTYTANAAFGSGTQIGTGNYVVYDGNDAGTVSVPLTALSAGTAYYFKMYEYNTSPNCYNVVSPATVNMTTRNPGLYSSSTTTQNTSTVAQNSLAAQIIGLQVVVSGGVDPAPTMNSITFTTIGTTNTADITNARIFYTGTSSTFASTTQFGSSFTSFSGNLTATGNFALSAGTNYFWIAYDLNVSATVNNVLDATIVSFNLTDTAGTSDRTPSITAPAGSRSIIASGATGYCTPACVNAFGDVLYTLQFAGNSYPGVGDYDNYDNWTSATGATVTPGQTYTLSYGADLLSYYASVSVWIDWNQSGVFDASEEVLAEINANSYSTSITVPVGAIPGATRMRLTARFGATNNPCTGSNGSSTSSFMADYTVNVSGSGGSQNVACATTSPIVTTPVSYSYNASASQLSATGSSLLWYAAASGGTGSGTASTPTTTTPGTTAYYVSQTSSCEGPRTQIAVDVSAASCCIAPSSASAGSNSPVCIGSTITLTSTLGVGSSPSYSWVGPNGFSASNAQSVGISGASSAMAGTYTVTVTNSCGSVTATTTVIIDSVPSGISAGSNSPVCAGSSLSLTSSVAGGTPTLSYSWSGPGYSSSAQNPTVSTNATTGMTGTYSVTISNNCGSTSTTTSVSVTNCTFNYTVKLFLQGYYTASNSMSPLLHLLGASSSTAVDTVTIEFHRSSSPYDSLYGFTGVLASNGNITGTVSGSALSGSYYIIVKHRNSIETWSASAQSLTSGGSYDFTSGAGQAYGSMANLGSGVYGIYSGDVNKDGAINLADKYAMQSVLSTFKIGVYNVNDITGDGFVDEEDYKVLENNIPLNISVSHP